MSHKKGRETEKIEEKYKNSRTYTNRITRPHERVHIGVDYGRRERKME